MEKILTLEELEKKNYKGYTDFYKYSENLYSYRDEDGFFYLIHNGRNVFEGENIVSKSLFQVRFKEWFKECIEIEEEKLNQKLLEACKSGDVEEAKELLKKGANVNATNNDGYTALILASFYGDTEIVKLIEEFKNNNENKKGFKEIDGKLPMYTVLFKQFPNAIKKIFIIDEETERMTKSKLLSEAIKKIIEGDITRAVFFILKAISENKKVLETDYPLLSFPKSLECVAQCSVLGHEKYKNYDEDWQNFARVPDAYNHYLNAAIRHFLEEELPQVAWNLIAAIEVEERNKNI